MTSKKLGPWMVTLAAATMLLAGCHTDMWRQPKQLAQQPSEFFADGIGDRKPIEGTVAFNGLRQDDSFYKGRQNGKLVTEIPPTLTINGNKVDTKTNLEAVLRRGKERFEIFCTHCHGAVGDGKGMISQRGLRLRRNPASYHTDRLREMPIGHFYDVITHGYGVMFPFDYRIEANDRWAIAAYIRVLQRSQNASAEDAATAASQPTGETTEGGNH